MHTFKESFLIFEKPPEIQKDNSAEIRERMKGKKIAGVLSRQNLTETDISTDLEIEATLNALSFENIAKLEETKIDDHFKTLRKAVDAKKITLEQIKERIFPKDIPTAAILTYTEKGGKKLTTQESRENELNPQDRADSQRWTKLIQLFDKFKNSRTKYLQVYLAFLKTFGDKLNLDKKSYLFKDNSIGLIPENLRGSHEEALDVFFIPENKGRKEIGPEVLAIESGVVIDAASDWETDWQSKLQGKNETKKLYKGGGFNKPISGNGVIILTANGELHYYAHFSSTSVKIGDLINAGNIIGRGGNTGTNAMNTNRGKHVHLEIRKIDFRGKKIDPYNNEEIKRRISALKNI
jgi:hypothetical protein